MDIEAGAGGAMISSAFQQLYYLLQVHVVVLNDGTRRDKPLSPLLIQFSGILQTIAISAKKNYCMHQEPNNTKALYQPSWRKIPSTYVIHIYSSKWAQPHDVNFRPKAILKCQQNTCGSCGKNLTIKYWRESTKMLVHQWFLWPRITNLHFFHKWKGKWSLSQPLIYATFTLFTLTFFRPRRLLPPRPAQQHAVKKSEIQARNSRGRGRIKHSPFARGIFAKF